MNQFEIDPRKIHVHDDNGYLLNPRGKVGNVDDLARDIEKNDQLEVVTVHMWNGRYHLLHGHRRHAACLKLDKDIRCAIHVKKLETIEDVIGAMIELHRSEDIPEVVQYDGVVVAGEAKTAQYLYHQGNNVAKIATIISKPVNRTHGLVKINDCCPAVVRAVCADELGLTVAYPTLTNLEPGQQELVIQITNKSNGTYSRPALVESIKILEANGWQIPEKGEKEERPDELPSLTSADEVEKDDVPETARDHLQTAVREINKAMIKGVGSFEIVIVQQLIDKLEKIKEKL